MSICGNLALVIDIGRKKWTESQWISKLKLCTIFNSCINLYICKVFLSGDIDIFDCKVAKHCKLLISPSMRSAYLMEILQSVIKAIRIAFQQYEGQPCYLILQVIESLAQQSRTGSTMPLACKLEIYLFCVLKQFENIRAMVSLKVK